MFSALRHRAFRRLFAAHVVALLGTGLSTIAIGFLVFDTTGSGAAGVLGTLLGIKMLTFLLIGPLAPAIARRVGAKRLLVLTDLARVGVAVALPFVGDVVTAYLLIIVLQSASALFTPTFQATIPAVVTDERQYTGALALSRLAYDIEALVSPTIASVVVVIASSNALFFGTGAGFLASALLILSAALPKAPAPVRGAESIRREITRGSKLMLRVPRLRAVLTLHLALAAVGAIAMVLTLPLVLGELGGDEAQAASLLAVYGAGSITSAILMPTMIARLGLRPFMLGGLTLMSAVMALVWPVLALAPGQQALPWLYAIWFFGGLGYSAVLAPMGRVIREAVPDVDLPDVFAAQFSLAHGWWLISFPLAGWGATVVGFGPTTLVLAVVAALALGVAAHAWRAPSSGEIASTPGGHARQV
ncbi:MFS transporter [Agrococcus sp. 1P02AA]|uniref:MFS transporter n=1 Tax=Agrococcus sp. 1P02AA TaxID=3132259 RepID=UPI0039A64C14